MEDLSLIDAIYEAALIPEQWLSVLDRLLAQSGSASGAMLVFSQSHQPRGVVTPLCEDFFSTFLSSDEWHVSARVQRMLALQPTKFTPVNDHVLDEEAVCDPVWKNLRTRGIEHQLCTMVPLPNGEIVTYTTERLGTRGPYDCSDIFRLNALRPHLARAGLLAARLKLEQASTAVATLEKLGLAAAVIGTSGKVIVSNTLLDAMGHVVIPTAFGKLTLANPIANAEYRDSLAQFASHASTATRSIAVAGGFDQPACIIHLLPLSGMTRDIFTDGRMLMILTVVRRVGIPDARLLRGLFHLTSAEVHLVQQLCAGNTINQLAQKSHRSVATLRTQLSAVLAKTGTARQSDLMRLIAALSAP